MMSLAQKTPEYQANIQAAVECGLFFNALRCGDYATAARSQTTLKDLGWVLTRDKAANASPRRKPRKARGGVA